jgi:ABC-type lipoprotein release transport system permease subunit
MSSDTLGRVAVRLAVKYVRRRYRRQIRIGVGIAIAGVAVAVYVASRNVPEG